MDKTETIKFSIRRIQA